MTLDSLPPLRAVIAEHGLNAKKHLGQNFLLDPSILARIAAAPGDLRATTVIEIGPGPGGLTRALLEAGARRVIAIEKDPRCIPPLEAIAALAEGRLELHLADALSVDLPALLAPDEDTVVVANLPYNVGTALLTDWLSLDVWPPWWRSLTLMFQKEVAQRIIAKPDTSGYGRLAVLSQWRARADLLFTLPPGAFVPAPKVESALVRLTPTAPRAGVKAKTLAQLTAAAFGQRRKMLRSSLKAFTTDPESLLAKVGLDPTRRAETLTIDDFCRLALYSDATR